jgi:glucose/arabinose dehydrogenase
VRRRPDRARRRAPASDRSDLTAPTAGQGWRRLARCILTLASVSLTACGPGADRQAPTPSDGRSSTPRATASPSHTDAATATPTIALHRIATLEQPTAMAVRAGDERLYVAEKTGRVVALAANGTSVTPVLDLRAEVSLGAEQGLLGLAFSPDGRYLYVDFTDTLGDTRVLEFEMAARRANPATRRQLLFVDQPYSNHNGGELAFGPDGLLYVGLGDGGSGGDPHGNGQSLSTLLGKILRISPRPSNGRAYTIPADNPFIDRGDARPEIWDYGLRNPWRFSFDHDTGNLWIADVGQSSWEEVDVQPAGRGGANFGWNVLEGSHPYSGADPDPSMIRPVYEYAHDGQTCSISGGYVYRGSVLPALVGWYVFGDFCTGELEGLDLSADGTHVVRHATLGATVQNLAAFGEDADGELYALSLSGPVYRIVPTTG